MSYEKTIMLQSVPMGCPEFTVWPGPGVGHAGSVPGRGHGQLGANLQHASTTFCSRANRMFFLTAYFSRDFCCCTCTSAASRSSSASTCGCWSTAAAPCPAARRATMTARTTCRPRTTTTTRGLSRASAPSKGPTALAPPARRSTLELVPFVSIQFRILQILC